MGGILGGILGQIGEVIGNLYFFYLNNLGLIEGNLVLLSKQDSESIMESDDNDNDNDDDDDDDDNNELFEEDKRNIRRGLEKDIHEINENIEEVEIALKNVDLPDDSPKRKESIETVKNNLYQFDQEKLKGKTDEEALKAVKASLVIDKESIKKNN